MNNIDTDYGIKLKDVFDFNELSLFGFEIHDEVTIMGHYAVKEFNYQGIKEVIRIEKVDRIIKCKNLNILIRTIYDLIKADIVEKCPFNID